jgi:hypothetical protein
MMLCFSGGRVLRRMNRGYFLEVISSEFFVRVAAT